MNDRTCPFPGCGKPIESDKFSCRSHWSQMTAADRKKIYDEWHKYQGRKITLAKLREIQAAVVARYGPPPVVGDERKRLEQFAILVERYLAHDARYRKCPAGLLELKQRLGTELRRARAKVDEALRSILHPPQDQPALFDDTPPEKGATNLPD